MFVRQTLQTSRRTGWQETSTSLHIFTLQNDKAQELFDERKQSLLRGIFGATVTTRPEEMPELTAQLLRSEGEIVESLRRPSEEEMIRQIRYAVMPLFAGIIS
ncbi:MAG: hypothetical protein BroJett039_08330 [Chloroflexota bacterium]|nr:MAG: hypothetical protein BroJett039_08330 [Chloroflexota bacterium]